MELRIQAHFTTLIGHPDYNLCRAYMPYDCHTYNEMFALVVFDYKNPEHLKHAYDWEWFNNKDNKQWEPTDLHTKTTLTAFPEFADKTDTKIGKALFIAPFDEGIEDELFDSLF